jgi:hypothetical protein
MSEPLVIACGIMTAVAAVMTIIGMILGGNDR